MRSWSVFFFCVSVLLSCATTRAARIYSHKQCVKVSTGDTDDTIHYDDHRIYTKGGDFLRMILFPVAPEGLGTTWENRSKTAPEYGVLYESDALVQKLKTSLSMTHVEWGALNITNLKVYHYIVVNGDYIVPSISHHFYNSHAMQLDQELLQRHPDSHVSVQYNSTGNYFELHAVCIDNRDLLDKPTYVYNEQFEPQNTIIEFSNLIPSDMFYRQMKGMPRVQFRNNKINNETYSFTAVMAVDPKANIEDQWTEMQDVLENTILRGVLRDWERIFTEKEWHDYVVLKTEYDLLYMVSNMTVIPNVSKDECNENMYACIDGTKEAPFFCFNTNQYCYETNLCSFDQYRTSGGTCDKTPDSYFNSRGSALERKPVNNPMFAAFYDKKMNPYYDDIVAMERVDALEQHWRAELFLTQKSLEKGAEAVVDTLLTSMRKAMPNINIGWRYAMYNLKNGGTARDMERLVLDLHTDADVGAGRPSIASEIFRKEDCINVRSDGNEKLEDLSEWKEKTIEEGKMTLRKNTSDVRDNTQQDYRSKIEAKGGTLEFDQGVYTMQADCIIYDTVYQPEKKSAMWDIFVREIRRQHDQSETKPIRVLWQNKELVVGIPTHPGADAATDYDDLKRLAEEYMLDAIKPMWRTCYPNATWMNYTLENDGYQMVATFDSGLKNTSCPPEPACPADRPHRDMVLCAPILDDRGKNTFDCMDPLPICLSKPLCSRGEFFNGTDCRAVPANKYSFDRQNIAERPSGDSIFDRVYAAVVASDSFLGANVQKLTQVEDEAWSMVILLDTYLKSLGVNQIIQKLKSSIREGEQLDISNDVSKRRRLLQTATETSRLTLTIRQPVPAPAPAATPEPAPALAPTTTPVPKNEEGSIDVTMIVVVVLAALVGLALLYAFYYYIWQRPRVKQDSQFSMYKILEE